ncbi:MAG: tetratricopeptide repeat protein [Clostridiales bacterium]|nr:tetratricopeptide repeat protein [Clostridiales bacterium]
MSENERLNDRIGEYLIPRVDEYVFDELSDNYLAKAGITDILKDVPIPIKKTEMTGLTTLTIAKNMACIIGCDINFKYRDNYIEYIKRTFSAEFAKPLISEGVDEATSDNYEGACVLFRAAMLIDPDAKNAYFCYGRACKDAYENGEGEEYIGRFKAESLEAFEQTTLKDPSFDMGFYFLGFAYVNLGLYIKAKLTWDDFMKLSKEADLRDEVGQFLDKLVEPCKIEEGYNDVLSGRFQQGVDILSPYESDDRFNTWWPLWYYLGCAYKGLEDADEAEKHFLKALQFSPSNVDSMKELVELYKALGNDDKAEKYSNKIDLVMSNAALDREEKKAAEMPGLS